MCLKIVRLLPSVLEKVNMLLGLNFDKGHCILHVQKFLDIGVDSFA